MTKTPTDPVEGIKAMWQGLYRLMDLAIARGKAAIKDEDMQRLKEAMELNDLAREQMNLMRAMEDLAWSGRKFKLGRRPNTGGPIRKAIAKALKRQPAMKNPELWLALAAAPPRGWQFFDNRAGKYVEGPAADEIMSYARFCNVCSEERKALKGA